MHRRFPRSLYFGIALLATFPAQARPADPLAGLINSYRAAPGMCAGRTAKPMAPLAPHAALSEVKLGTGMFLDLELARRGYRAEHADILYVSGAATAHLAMEELARTSCKILLDARFAVLGSRRTGDNWQVVLAQPEIPPPIVMTPDLSDFGQIILAAANAARAKGATCGSVAYPPVPPLVWNEALAAASRGHSLDMATQHYYDHQGKDGRLVTARAGAAGYHSRRLGENIAVGQRSAEEVANAWLTSPGHCANIMEPEFREMGVAYAIRDISGKPRVYWTQVFGKPF